jgi:hypothetical protein
MLSKKIVRYFWRLPFDLAPRNHGFIWFFGVRGTTTRYDARCGWARILDPPLTTAQYLIPVLQPSRPQRSKRLICASSTTDGKDPVPQWPCSSWQGQEGNSRPFAYLGWLFDGMHLDDTIIIFFYCYIFVELGKWISPDKLLGFTLLLQLDFCEQNSHLAVSYSRTCSPFLANLSNSCARTSWNWLLCG